MSTKNLCPGRWLIAHLLASTAVPAFADSQTLAQANPPGATAQDEIVVTGTREKRAAVEGIEPERTVDSEAIASYGSGTVGDVLAEIARETGEPDEEPLLFVNGVPIADPGDIIDYPSEAIERIDVLPRGSGARLGAAADRRAYNVVLRRSFSSTIGVVSDRLSTDGGWNALSGEFFYTRISGQQRLNITARVSDESLLRESQRGLAQPEPDFAYDLLGNVIAAPGSGSAEIDPALSAMAGSIVNIAALPGSGQPPSLADIVAGAGRPNTTALGFDRSLRPATRRYSFGLTGNQPITDWLSGVLTARWERDQFTSLQGLRAGLLILPTTSPLSPFSRDVVIARYDDEALRYETQTDRANIDLTLNAQRGEWLLSMRSGYRVFAINSDSERQDHPPTQPHAIEPGSNPFARDISALLPVSIDRSRSKTTTLTSQFLASGKLFELPSGDVRTALTAGWTEIDQEGSTRSRFFDFDRNSKRTEWLGSVSLEIPLVGPELPGLGAIGTVSSTLDYALTHVPGLGEIERAGAGLRWVPFKPLDLGASIVSEKRLPDPSQLGDPRTVSENVRYFDPVRQETVDVTQIGGGNPDLLNERLETTRMWANYMAWRALELRLTGEYTRTALDNPVAYLPPSSSDLVAAFPDRFVRNASGALASIDIRPVNFVKRTSERLRWGATFLIPLSASLRPGPDGTMPAPVGGQARWRLQGSVNHTIELAGAVTLRAGLPALDLLGGGAVGFGGATTRHRADGSLGINDRDIGVRLHANWRSDALLNVGAAATPSQLRFASFATFDLRAFADLRQLITQVEWFEKTKITLGIANIMNVRQRIANELGETPLRYQPNYRDPLGRVVEIELRRQF